MSRLATVVGALSAIVTLADYLAAKSFLSGWLHEQIRRDNDGWRISPTLNLLLMVAIVGAVWLLTESPAADPQARKRLLGLRTNLILLSIGVWFFVGPSIGTIEELPPQTASNLAQPANDSLNGGSAQRAPVSPSMTASAGSSLPGPTLSRGRTSQFTWQQGAPSSPTTAWRPGDGLRAMARLLEDVSTPPARIGR